MIPFLRNTVSIQTTTRSICAFYYAWEEIGRLGSPYMTASNPCSRSWESRLKSIPSKMGSRTSRGALMRRQGILQTRRRGQKPAAIRLSLQDVLLFTHRPTKGARLVQARDYGHRPVYPSQTSEAIRARKQNIDHPQELPPGHLRELTANMALDTPRPSRREAG